jgi:hypothetical protein
MGLVGKFFFHCGDEYMHSGEIVEQVDPATVLVRTDKCACNSAPPMGMQLVRISEMITDNLGEPGWEFFGTRQELDDYWTWLDKPSEEKAEAAVPGQTLN